MQREVSNETIAKVSVNLSQWTEMGLINLPSQPFNPSDFSPMLKVPLGHRLSRELMRRGNRRAFFRAAQYRELRRVDSAEELADFLDRNGYTRSRASENIDEVADDILIQCNSPGIFDPAKVGVISPTLGLLLLPIMVVYHLVWGFPSDKE